MSNPAHARAERRAVAALALAAGLAARVTPAAAQAAQGAQRRDAAIVGLVVNGGDRTDVVVYRVGADVYVGVDDLCAVRLCNLAQPVDIDGANFISLAGLEPKIRFWFDGSTQLLTITAAPSAFPRQVIDVRDDRRPAHLEYRHDTSLFVNYAAHVRTSGDPDAFVESGLSVGGGLLYSSVSALQTGQVLRGLSTASWDARAEMIRVSAGDAIATTGTLGGTAIIGGLTLGREFAIDPYFTTMPTLTRTGVADTPSTLEIYVDGRLVERRAIAPGSFEIDHIPTGSVVGDTKIVVRDALGRAQDIATGPILPQGLLAPELSQFSYSIGAVRNALANFDYGAPAVIAHHRQGLTPWLTANARLEATPTVISGGAGVSFAAHSSLVEINAAASAGTPPTTPTAGAVAGAAVGGAALSASYSRLARGATVSLFGQLVSDHYATINLASSDDRAIAQLGVQVGVPITQRVSLGAQLTAIRHRDAGDEGRATVSSAWQIRDNLRGDVGVSWSRDVASAPIVSATASLSVVIGPRTGAVMSLAQVARAAALSLSAYRALPTYGTGIGYRIDGELGTASGVAGAAGPAGSAEIDGQARFGRLTAQASWAGGNASALLGVAGGVALIGGRAFATLPVQDSFAVIRVPDAPNVRAFVDNRDVGTTDAHGDVFVPSLLAYYGNRISIDDSAVPLDRAIVDPIRIIAPTWRGGAVVELSPTTAPRVTGTIAVRSATGEDIDTAFGELVIATGATRVSSPVGRHGEFELDQLAPGDHRARIDYGEGACAFTLHVGMTTAPVIALGTVTCTLGGAP